MNRNNFTHCTCLNKGSTQIAITRNTTNSIVPKGKEVKTTQNVNE